jgi:DNA-binding NarL/FixJ family response regulator
MIMLAKGKSVAEIAAEIFISDKTVATYRSRIMEKMQMKKNAEVTIYALRNKLIE